MRGKGKRKVDISKDDYFMAIAKLATTRSTSEPKVQSLQMNIRENNHKCTVTFISIVQVGACLVTVDPHRAVGIGYGEYDKPPCYSTENGPYQMQSMSHVPVVPEMYIQQEFLRAHNAHSYYGHQILIMFP